MPTVVQSAGVGTPASVITFASPVAAGNLLVVTFANGSSVTASTASDTLGSSWSSTTGFNGIGACVKIFYAIAAGAGSCTITIGTPGSSPTIAAVEISGAQAVLDGTPVATNGDAPGSLTTTVANSIVVANLGGYASSCTWAALSGWAITQADWSAVATMVQVAPGAVAPTFPGTNHGSCSTAMAAFKAVPGGGGGGVPGGGLGSVPSVLREGGFRAIPHTDGSSVGTLDLAAKNNLHAVRLRAPDTLGADKVVMTPQVWLCTQTTFPTLSADNAGMFVYVADYEHLIYWDGTAPAFAGDPSGRVAMFLVDPGAGWHLCDGSFVGYLNADGTTGTITLPDLTTGTYPKFDAAVSGVVAGTAGTITGDTGDADANLTLVPGTGGVGAGASLVANVTQTPHHHDSGTLAVAGNEPQHISLRAWFRL